MGVTEFEREIPSVYLWESLGKFKVTKFRFYNSKKGYPILNILLLHYSSCNLAAYWQRNHRTMDWILPSAHITLD